MSWDAQINLFEGLDANLLVEYFHFSDELGDRLYKKYPYVDGATWPPKAYLEEVDPILAEKRKILGLPSYNQIMEQRRLLEIKSKRHPEYELGYWGSLGDIDNLMTELTGEDWFMLFREAQGDGGFIKPAWNTAKQKLDVFLSRLRSVSSKDSRVSPHLFGDKELDLEWRRVQVDIMQEACEVVAQHTLKDHFLLYWSR
jgi:hypothetical protein